MRADPAIVQRWRDLRAMLITQLDMFETGRLSLTTAGLDVAPAAVADLKREILAFDALICEDEARADAAAPAPVSVTG